MSKGKEGQGRQGKARNPSIFQFCSTTQNTNPPFKLNFKKVMFWYYKLIFYLPYMEISCVDIYLYIEWIHSTSL